MIALVALAALPAPPAAPPRSRFVDDRAHVVSDTTIDAVHDRIRLLRARTGREIFVLTVPSLGSEPLHAAAARAFAAHPPHGALIFVSRAQRRGEVIAEHTDAASGVEAAMNGDLRIGDFNGAITTGVELLQERYQAVATRATAVRLLDPRAVPYGAASGTGPVVPRKHEWSWAWVIFCYVALFAVVDLLRMKYFGPRVPQAD